MMANADEDRAERVRVNVDGAVFKNIPKKQEPARHGFSRRYHITDEDVLMMGRGHDVEKILSGFADKMYLDVGSAMVQRLVNAGPHVVDFKVETYYDPLLYAQVVSASTPLLATKTYGPEVARADLVVRERGETLAVVEPAAPWWRRLGAAIVKAGTEDLSYDGPRGLISE